ncbi:PQQ-binding-like beta-propeller repeat protein [Pyxidicoccus fallax]|uniref:PQQ-binding-like beta-propeller repeat protein n=1 Tax=Pyxidicoccus fallax TaxID=394095 RepID=A0A848LZX8_9BACT|nr:PQQ-binding-like beta-propeller repeat protein [Pyxidicoccus fallax]NPC85853.1 PQQ-binding-like beta-propeller repeat protein [Pyxidicoccus fallax]
MTPAVVDEAGASLYLVAPDGAVRAHAVDTGKVLWSIPRPGSRKAGTNSPRESPAPPAEKKESPKGASRKSPAPTPQTREAAKGASGKSAAPKPETRKAAAGAVRGNSAPDSGTKDGGPASRSETQEATASSSQESPAPASQTQEASPDASHGFPAPLLAGGLLVVSLGDAGLVALSPDDGAQVWRRDVRDVVGMKSWRQALYVSTRPGRLLALNFQDGSPLWEQSPASSLTGPPSLSLGILWLGAIAEESPVLVGLSPADGKEVARLPLPDPLVTEVASLREDLLLVPTRGRQGRLVALRQPGWERVFSLRTDTPLRTRPVVMGDQVFVLGLDGRVLSWRVPPPEQ